MNILVAPKLSHFRTKIRYLAPKILAIESVSHLDFVCLRIVIVTVQMSVRCNVNFQVFAHSIVVFTVE